MFFVINMRGSLSFFHNPVKFGGNICCPSPTLVTLGSLNSKASCLEIFDFVTTYDISFRDPSLNGFKPCSYGEDICDLEVPPPLENPIPDDNPLLFQMTSILIASPLLQKAISFKFEYLGSYWCYLACVECRLWVQQNTQVGWLFFRKVLEALYPFFCWGWGTAKGLVPLMISEAKPVNPKLISLLTFVRPKEIKESTGNFNPAPRCQWICPLPTLGEHHLTGNSHRETGQAEMGGAGSLQVSGWEEESCKTSQGG